MKTILITGASGMLGAYLVSQWQNKYKIYATGNSYFKNNQAKKYKVFDLKKRSYKELSDWVNPDYIIHCAAITSHEYCDKNPKEAIIVNGESVKKFLKTFKSSKLIYISTDAVFPLGTHMAKENDETGPATIYGKSKELGEKYILRSKNQNCIIRTTIIGKNYNKNKESFVERIYKSLKNNRNISLFSDVIFTPITILSLANQIKILIDSRKKLPKILHIAGSEKISKFAFGMEFCKMLHLDSNKVKATELSKLKSKIKRSNNQSLDVSFFEKKYKKKLPNIKKTIKELTILFNDE